MTFQPEFCQSNYADINVNTDFTLTLTPATYWYQTDKKLLYDHRSDRKLYTTGADDDTTSVYATLDMSDRTFITDVKLLNTNAKSGLIEISDDAVTWVTLYTITGLADTSLHWHSTGPTECQYLQDEDGQVLTDTYGRWIEIDAANSGRYLRVTITTTQIPNSEKYIGELYIGQREIKITTGKVISYSEKNTDPKAAVYKDYNGTTLRNRRKSQYSSTMSIMRPSSAEALFLKSLEVDGGIYDFFPSGSYGDDIDYTLSIDTIVWVVASGTYGRNQYGNKASGVAQINLVESRVVN